MLTVLLDNLSRPASELAHSAGISQQSASMHLSKLLQGGLLTVVPQGRHRYYRLSSAEVASALESLGTIASSKTSFDTRGRGLQDIRQIRTCYDHMAGEIAVEISAALCRRKILLDGAGRNFEVTQKGERWFRSIGINCNLLKNEKRHFALRCLDWTERRYHIGGSLGCVLLTRFQNRAWVKAKPGSRALRLTEKGRDALRVLGLTASIKKGGVGARDV
jgi:DNA-binding transcriptional ArsR family regulator